MCHEKGAGISVILGGRPPLIFRLRGTRPPVPPLSTPMVPVSVVMRLCCSMLLRYAEVTKSG